MPHEWAGLPSASEVWMSHACFLKVELMVYTTYDTENNYVIRSDFLASKGVVSWGTKRLSISEDKARKTCVPLVRVWCAFTSLLGSQYTFYVFLRSLSGTYVRLCTKGDVAPHKHARPKWLRMKPLHRGDSNNASTSSMTWVLLL